MNEQQKKEGQPVVAQLTPDKNEDSGIKQPKKKRRHWPWIILAIVIIIIIVPLGMSGLFNIPVISDIFGTNQPIDLGVKSSPEALRSAMEKIPWTLEGDPADYTIFNKKEFSGQLAIDHRLTSEELTSFLNEYLQNDPYVSDIQVKMVPGGVEASGLVKKYINAPVYVKVDIARLSEKSVSLTFKEVKIGRVPITESLKQRAEDYLEDLINRRMLENTSFTMETLEYHDGDDIFKGTFPETVRVVSGPDWWGGLADDAGISTD